MIRPSRPVLFVPHALPVGPCTVGSSSVSHDADFLGMPFAEVSPCCHDHPSNAATLGLTFCPQVFRWR